MPLDDTPFGPSLWAVTAPKAPSTPPLKESTRSDVCVVGGGYAGLSTALHLREQGIAVTVLEAEEPGFGASGRNGGQVIPGLKWDPSQIIETFGPELGERVIAFAGRTADVVFDLITKHAMDVPHLRTGWIQAAHTEAGVDATLLRAEQWAKRGVPVRVLDNVGAQSAIGSPKYVGGWIDPRGGAVQPLSYARELARVAIAAGARIHGQSPVVRMERSGGQWVVHTASGATVTAGKVVVCTNGYSGNQMVKGLERSVVAPYSYQIATVPLSDNVRKSILPGGQVCSDTRNLVFYFRLDHEGRLLIGGRGPLREPASLADWKLLENVMTKLFPQVANVGIAHRWCGRVAVTRDFLPHIHQPEPGLLAVIGCMGRGVALQSAIGKAMAEHLATEREDALPLPIVPVKALPMHALREAYIRALVVWYRLRDGAVA